MTSTLEAQFAGLVRMLAPDLPPYVSEHTFAKGRRWRFDAAWTKHRVAVELEGGVWSGGRHTRGSGFEADCSKYNRAALDGWIVLRYTASMLDHDPMTVIKQVREALYLRGADVV